jgi:superfamily I DNA/RNA helicase
MEVSFTDRFFPSVYDLAPEEVKQVVKAVNQLSTDPLHDALRLKPIQGDKTGRKYTCRANQDVRILLLKQGDVLLLDRAGHHDAMYELARRIDLVFNQGTGRVVVIDRSDEPPPTTVIAGKAPSAPSEKGPGLFDHWGLADLISAGLGDREIAPLRDCQVEDDLFNLDVDDETLSLLIDLLGQTPEQWHNPGLDAEAATTERIRRAILEHGGLAGISPLFSAEEIHKLTSGPIEDWMVFLHPDQRGAVDRHYEGPARVRGSAGTGKTVVALHRAAALARRFENEPSNKGRGDTDVLFTTFIKSLPPVFEHLYQRLPSSRSGDPVEFRHIDSLAYKVCAEAGDRPTLDPRKVDSTFATAFRATFPDAPATRDYLRDEVTQVIKGRGIRTLAEYLAIERTGRRTRFPEALRRQVWALKERWDQELGAAGVVDFPDVVLRARDHARGRSAPSYRAAIVDEAQDLTLVGLQLVRALVNGPGGDRPDGLVIVGDGAQRIYAGGFTLRQAGVEVRGRTTVLRTNYRNTAEIIEAAMAITGNEEVDDLGDAYTRGEAEAAAPRLGVRPILVRCAGIDDEARFIVDQIRLLTGSGAIGLGDIAVSAATNHQSEEIARRLKVAGLPTIKLEDYKGTPVDRVKVGTHFRIKGLEFRLVFLPCLGAGDFPRRPAPGQSVEELAEQRSLALSQLFVAMTRARDGLFLLASGEQSEVLAPALDHLEVIDS